MDHLCCPSCIDTSQGSGWRATPVDYSDTTYNISCEQLVHKQVRTTDYVEVGNLERIGNEFVMVREDVSNVHIYYVPKAYIRDNVGSHLWERRTEAHQVEI